MRSRSCSRGPPQSRRVVSKRRTRIPQGQLVGRSRSPRAKRSRASHACLRCGGADAQGLKNILCTPLARPVYAADPVDALRISSGLMTCSNLVWNLPNEEVTESIAVSRTEFSGNPNTAAQAQASAEVLDKRAGLPFAYMPFQSLSALVSFSSLKSAKALNLCYLL